MAEGSPRRRSPRRSGAQGSPPDNQPEPPKTFIELADRILSDFRRTGNLVCIVGAVAILLYTATAAVKGVHFLTLPMLVPGGLVVGPSITYCSARAGRKVGKLIKRALARAELPDEQPEEPAAVRKRKQDPQGTRQIPAQPPKPQSGRSRSRQGL
jgi:hypothetical protein